MLRRTTRLLKKNQDSCKKNFGDEATNKQLDKVKDHTQRSNFHQL